MAIPTSDADSLSNAGANMAFIIQNTVSQTMVPITLNARWTIAALLAFLLVPTDESIAVIQVPMFCPIMIGIAAPYDTCPVTARACKIPTEAELDCIMAVSRAPARTPSRGFSKAINKLLKDSTSFSPDTAADMASMPNIRVAKPSRIVPVSFFLLLLQNI